MTIIIDGFLTQSKLASALQQLIPSVDWVGTELKIPNNISNRYRWDMGFLENGKMKYVEFDGSQHYCNANAIWRDHRKDQIVKNSGASIIRIPYWVQLTNQTLNYYFGIDADITQDYPHGFIDKKAEVPASFCEMGINRFTQEFMELPPNIKKDVAISIQKKATNVDMKYVAPSKIIDAMSKHLIE